MTEVELEDMVAVPIESMIKGMTVPANVYVAINETKYILVFKSGAQVSTERMLEFSKRGVDHLFVQKDDYPLFFGRQFAVAGIVISHPKAAVSHKLSVLHVAGEFLSREFEEIGFAGDALVAAKSTAGSLVTLVNSEPSLMQLVNRLNSYSEKSFNHSVAVGMMNVMIARNMGWKRPETLEKLALGGILHDIGMQELPESLLQKSRAEMSYDEMKEYETHPFRGMQILREIPNMPVDVIAIAYEHHENAIGQGYPRRLWDMKANPLARVAAISETFCEMILVSETNPKPRTPEQALAHIEVTMGQPFNRDVFKSLKTLVMPAFTRLKAS